MFDIYQFVVTNLFPTLPTELYFLIPISCIVILFIIMLLVASPFLAILSLIKR